MLRKEQIEFYFPRSGGHHAFEKKWIRQIFKIAQLRITPHLPLGKRMQTDAKLLLHSLRILNLRTKNVHFMPPSDHLLHQVNRLGRSPAGWRKKRFMRKKGDL